MPVFCYECGAKMDDSSRFCPICGTPIQQMQKCSRCGADLDGTAAFCGKCGAPVNNRRSASASSSAPHGINNGQLTNTAKSVAASLEKVMFSAPNSAGEFVYGSVRSIPNAANVISDGFRNMITSVKGFFKNPKALIPTLCISVVWLLLNILKANGTDNQVTRILSVLTFSNAGIGTNALGAIGGVLGKGVFAGALVSLVYTIAGIGKRGGEKRGFAETLKGSFGFDRGTVWSYAFGVGLSLILFVFMAGKVDYSSVMGGAAAAFLSAKSASGGFLSRLLLSVESNSKIKIFNGIPRGMAAGFALGAALCFIPNCSIWLLIAGAVIVVFSSVMMILQKAGVLGSGGKEVGTV